MNERNLAIAKSKVLGTFGGENREAGGWIQMHPSAPLGVLGAKSETISRPDDRSPRLSGIPRKLKKLLAGVG